MMKGVTGAIVAFDPLGGAVRVVFFFPDGDGCFDGVNDGTTGAEGSIAVGGGDDDADGHLANLQETGAVDAACRDNVMLIADFCKDAITLLLCEGREGLIFKGENLAPLMVITHPAFETGKASGRWVSYRIT